MPFLVLLFTPATSAVSSTIQLKILRVAGVADGSNCGPCWDVGREAVRGPPARILLVPVVGVADVRCMPDVMSTACAGLNESMWSGLMERRWMQGTA